jgi:hypothetical protein
VLGCNHHAQVGKHHAACIAISPDGTQLVAAGAFIKLFSVASQVPSNQNIETALP